MTEEKIKIGLSIKKSTYERLEELKKEFNLKKGESIDEAIELFYKRQVLINKRIKELESKKNDVFISDDELNELLK